VVGLIEILSPIIVLALFGILTPIVGFICERGRVRNLVGAWALFGFIIAFMACFRLMSLLNSKPVIVFSLYPIAGEYVAGFMVLDWLSFAFSIGFIFLGLISTLHSIDYMSHDTGLPSYYSLLLLMVCGMVGVTLAGDFLTLYVFWELMSLSSYCLVGFRKHLWEPVEAGFKYLLMSAAWFSTNTILHVPHLWFNWFTKLCTYSSIINWCQSINTIIRHIHTALSWIWS
jgi:formate hydrogenlyase subunit 3/multisubunit Na+/H+ antiporter MnhD subunit